MLGNLNEDTGVLKNVLTREEALLQVSYFVIKQGTSISQRNARKAIAFT
jgi:hypothetical protein